MLMLMTTEVENALILKNVLCIIMYNYSLIIDKFVTIIPYCRLNLV